MPSDAAAIFRACTELLAEARAEEALAILGAALAEHAEHPGILCRYGDCLQVLARIGDARDVYRRAVALDPALFDAWYGLGCAELAARAYGAAVQSLGRAVALEPARLDARFNLGKALFELGEIDRAIDHFEAAAAAEHDELRDRALLAIACIIPGSPRADNGAILAARRRWAACQETEGDRLAAKAPPPRRKLRVGYVSAFFGDRNWMKPVWAMINRHDRSAFDLYLISDGEDPGAASGYRDHDADHILAVRGLANDALAEEIRRMEIDILVDLNGYSFTPRLGLFAWHPAPVTLGWFNSFATSGLRGIDYIVGDAAVIPPEEERFYGERVLRVGGTYLAFAVDYPVPDIAPPPSLADGRLVFGCLGAQYKITDAVIAAWAEILRRAPTSALLLRNGHLDDASTQEALRRRFAAQGIASDRLHLAGRAEHFTFLETYARIDIALDTFPYNGGTTTMEALWQGVPVLTFNGDRWAGRTSRSLLVAAGLRDWVMPSRAAYIERAVALAEAPDTPQRLAELRIDMRRRLGASPACDGEALCRDMERLYRAIAGRTAPPDAA